MRFLTAALVHRRRATIAAVLGLLLVPSSAAAGPLLDAVGTCDGQVSEQAFLPWLDPGQYVLAPDGDFAQGGTGWQLEGAHVVAQNEPWYVHGPGAPAALRIPSGASATSPAMCVTLVHPTLRLFARNEGSLLGTLRVEVLFEDLLGRLQSLPIGTLAGAPAWEPTLPMPVVANLLALLPDARTPVAFRFTPRGSGAAWLIDDVYVDPYCKR